MVFFKTFEFEFEARRLMWYAPYGGSDFGEIEKISSKIEEKNYESWYINWKKLAWSIIDKNYSNKISKAYSYLRASRYFQAAEFFLHPSDTRKIEVYNKSVEYFYKGLDLLEVSYKINLLEYKNIKLRSLLFETSKNCKGTLYICGGFDALLEELYFTNAKIALEQGYNVVLFEGPGQSDVIRKYKVAFTENWDEVSKVVVDFYSNISPAPKIGIGVSLGGLLIARSESLSPKVFDRIILYNYFPNMLDSFKINIPKLFHKYVDSKFPKSLEKIVAFYISKNNFLNWQVEHAKWTFGASALNELLEVCRKFKELALKTPTLMFLAKHDNYYDYKLGINYFNTIESDDKKLIIFDKESYASDLHCQNGAAYDSNNEIFEWLDSVEKRKLKNEVTL